MITVVDGALINSAIIARIKYVQEDDYHALLLDNLRKINKYILDASDGKEDMREEIKLLRYVSELENIISDFAVKKEAENGNNK